ncbi:MAG: DUF4330 domain-containing protein [Vulcanococcus sp.]|jgi:hypothetical protein|uniref:DUF4330 domain-containing protein n=1 Tax=Vulcanococcus sp. TaxID=2856995 RepID=UPI0025F271DD|nr:DUF4330 domain-containing protein [Vulcanococcus sp.]MBW0167670.1 DUF4330 domain-containing protein [Vulcanococcus sp.]
MAENSRRFSLVDAGAAAAVLLAAAGVIWSPKLSGAVARATGGLVPVTVMVDVRGVPVADPAALINAAREGGKVAIVIRNQPHGSVPVEQVIPLQRRLAAVLPDGKVVSAPDPNQDQFPSLDARFVLRGEGRKGADGVVFGNQNLKIGAPIELEGTDFRVTGSVTGLKVGS